MDRLIPSKATAQLLVAVGGRVLFVFCLGLSGQAAGQPCFGLQLVNRLRAATAPSVQAEPLKKGEYTMAFSVEVRHQRREQVTPYLA